MLQAPAGEVLFRLLENLGVEDVFGLRVYKEYDYKSIRPIVVHNEAAAALMAMGYAKTLNKPGVCVGHDGPGAVYMVPGLYSAFRSSIPVVAFLDATDISKEGKNAINEIDQLSLLRPCTKWTGEAILPEQTAWMVNTAFESATTGCPGPVAINLHFMSVVRESAPVDTNAKVNRTYGSFPALRLAPEMNCILNAVKLLFEAEKPVIVAGGGVHISQAYKELFILANLLQAPVATTATGKGSYPEDHHLSLGCVGSHFGGKHARGRIANEVVGAADVVLLVGTRTGEMETSGWTVPSRESRVININMNPAEIEMNYATEVAILGDAELSLESLNEVLSHEIRSGRKRTNPLVKRMKSGIQNWRELVKPIITSEQEPMDPRLIMAELQRVINDTTTIVTDNSQSCVWTVDSLQVPAGKTFMASRAMAAIGIGLPMAIGVKVADSSRKVICVEGDGGILEGVITELETASRYDAPVTVLLMNNGAFGLERLINPNGRTHFDFESIDYTAIAKGFGCQGVRVERPSEIRDALKVAVKSDKPTLIDCVVDPKVIPPMKGLDG